MTPVFNTIKNMFKKMKSIYILLSCGRPFKHIILFHFTQNNEAGMKAGGRFSHWPQATEMMSGGQDLHSVLLDARAWSCALLHCLTQCQFVFSACHGITPGYWR